MLPGRIIPDVDMVRPRSLMPGGEETLCKSAECEVHMIRMRSSHGANHAQSSTRKIRIIRGTQLLQWGETIGRGDDYKALLGYTIKEDVGNSCIRELYVQLLADECTPRIDHSLEDETNP